MKLWSHFAEKYALQQKTLTHSLLVFPCLSESYGESMKT